MGLMTGIVVFGESTFVIIYEREGCPGDSTLSPLLVFPR